MKNAITIAISVMVLLCTFAFISVAEAKPKKCYTSQAKNYKVCTKSTHKKPVAKRAHRKGGRK